MGFLNEIRSHRYRTWKCVTLCLIYLGVGIVCSFPGPTLLDLQIAVNASMDQIALIIPIDASGHMFGSVIGAFALSYFDHQVIILYSLFVMSISFSIIPYCRSLITIYSTLIINGLSTGFLLNAGNVWVIHMWGKENTPFMQLIHFAYGLGCFLGPIIAEPFLLQNPTDKDTEAMLEMTHHNLRIQYGYMIGCCINLVFWIIFLFTYVFHRRNKEHPTRQKAITSRTTSVDSSKNQSIDVPIKVLPDNNTQNDKEALQNVGVVAYSSSDSALKNGPPNLSLAQLLPEQPIFIHKNTRRLLVIVAACFVHVTYGLELSFGILLPIYAVKSTLGLSKSTASFLTSLYWACFTFPKLLAAMCSSRVSVRTLLWIELCLICTANFFLMPFGDDCEWALWVGTALIGCGVSSVFPCLLGQLELLFPVSGKVTSLFTTFSCFGEFILPMVIGVYIETHPQIFLHVTLLYSLLSVVFYVILLLIEMKIKRNNERQTQCFQSKSSLKSSSC